MDRSTPGAIATLVALTSLAACTGERPRTDAPASPAVAPESGSTAACGATSRADARRVNRLFVERHTTSDGYIRGITGHGISRDDDGWFLLVIVDPSARDASDRHACFEGVRVECEPGGPFIAH